MVDLAVLLSILSLVVAAVSFLRLVYTAWIARPAAELERKDLEIVRALAFKGLTLDTLVRSLDGAEEVNKRSILQHLHVVSKQTRESIDDAIGRGILLSDGMKPLASYYSVSASVYCLKMSQTVSTETVPVIEGDAFWYVSLAQILTNATYELDNSDQIADETWANSEQLWLSAVFKKHLKELLDSCVGFLKKSPFAVDRTTAKLFETESTGTRTVTMSVGLNIGIASVQAERSTIRGHATVSDEKTSEV